MTFAWWWLYTFKTFSRSQDLKTCARYWHLDTESDKTPAAKMQAISQSRDVKIMTWRLRHDFDPAAHPTHRWWPRGCHYPFLVTQRLTCPTDWWHGVWPRNLCQKIRYSPRCKMWICISTLPTQKYFAGCDIFGNVVYRTLDTKWEPLSFSFFILIFVLVSN